MAKAHNGMFPLLSRMVLEDHPACPGCGYVPQAKATYISLPSPTLASYAKAVSKYVASDGTTPAFFTTAELHFGVRKWQHGMSPYTTAEC